MEFPENLRYTKDHEWVSLDGDIATIGITSFAQGELGDVVFVDIPTEGESLEIEEIFGTIEAVKTVADLFMPLSGEVHEINPGLESNPEKVNEDPYGEGWMVRIKLSDPSQFDNLISAEEYRTMVS
jgi:glycine cleavage system H protein